MRQPSQSRRWLAALSATLALVVTAPPGALAHSGSTAPADEHAAEHAAVARAIARFDRLPAAKQRRIRQRLLGTGRYASARRLADAPAEEIGRWTSAPFDTPDYSIHAVLLRGGRVLLFAMGSGHGVGPGSPGNGDQALLNDGQATIWDPSLGEGPDAFTEVDPPPIPLEDPFKRTGYDLLRPAPIFCAGQVQLADGRILIAGGNLDAPYGTGLKLMYLFDPVAETWVREANMVHARWYPSLTRLADGRVSIIGGLDENHDDVGSLELYPGTGTAVAGVDDGAPLTGITTSEAAARRANGTYPHSFLLPSGRLASSYGGAGRTALFEPTTGRWVGRTDSLVVYGSYPTAFLRPGDEHGPHEIIQTGGLRLDGAGNEVATSATYAIDPEQEKRWRAAPALNVPRRNATSVLLPDGSAVVVNGGGDPLRFPTGGGLDQLDPNLRRVELWDPATGRWRLGPASATPRGYHSVALLLADGRVMAGGDDNISSLLDTNRNDKLDSTTEIYSPPYLFRGERPTITAAPTTAGYAETLPVQATVAEGRSITRATLVAPGSVTHAFNMNQRVLELPVRPDGAGGFQVTGPTTSGAAPPGDYMLFMLDDRGVPSVASWIRVRPSFPGQGTPTLTVLSGEQPPVVPKPTTPGATTPEPPTPTTPEPTTPQATTPQLPQGERTPPPTPRLIPTPPPLPPLETPPALVPLASSAVLKGRVVRVVAILRRTGKVCPTRVQLSVRARRVTTTRRLKVRRIVDLGKVRCRATGKLTLRRTPRKRDRVSVRVSGRHAQTLRLTATRAAAKAARATSARSAVAS